MEDLVITGVYITIRVFIHNRPLVDPTFKCHVYDSLSLTDTLVEVLWLYLSQ